MTRLTPIRSQYLKIKQNHLDAILLFRMGDFYETFDTDAELTSKILDITLTSKEMGKGDRVPLAGIPYHSLDGYLAKLIKAGHKVAICDQIGKVPVKGLVEREVVRIVTPGTVTESALLEQKYNNYLASVVVKSDIAGLSYMDITTGEFLTTEVPLQDLAVEIDRIAPAELITTPNTNLTKIETDIFVTNLENPESLDPTNSVKILKNQFGVSSLEGFGCDDMPMAIWAASNLITYLSYTQNAVLSGVTGLRTYHVGLYMKMDRQTHQTLELFKGGRRGESSQSLVSMIDLTRTPPGGRLLRSWIGQPLLDLEALEQRQNAVDNLYQKPNLREYVSKALNSIPDIERILSKIVTRKAMPRELVSLKNALKDIIEIRSSLMENDMPNWIYSEINPCSEVISIVEDSLEDYPAASPSEGRIIRRGLSENLDKLRDISQQSRKYISGLESREKERTGIKSLKVGYNRVFGYYIEISRSNLSLVPSDYSPRQTLVGGERFITPELKEYESILLNAHEEIEKLESSLFENICSQIISHHEPIVTTAYSIARLDVLTSFAESAYRYEYVKPKLSKDDTISIEGGRHPIVERNLPHGSFVPNDTLLSNQHAQVMILTGPNMSGKSTYIKQTALIVLMSQLGSFVPAEAASIGLVDRIFTRAGLQDDLYAGQSTFMVEMTETANILRHATPKSLIILDEIGRGTSTYDGLAIARAVAEHIHNNPDLGCKTMFATHYHELIALTDLLPRIHNQNVGIVENGDTAIFLHRILPGGSNKSYGVHVAQLAGLPSPVINRAKELLWELENNQNTTHLIQKPLFELANPLVDELKRLNLSDVTPMQALNILFEMQNKINDD